MAIVGTSMILGLDSGHLQVWDIQKVNQIHQVKAHKGRLVKFLYILVL